MKKPIQMRNLLTHRHLLPPPISRICTCEKDSSHSLTTTNITNTTALLHTVYARVGRAAAFLCLLVLPLLMGSCEKELVRYAEMVQLHQESCGLPEVTADSVGRFTQKVDAFVTRHPAAREDPLYPDIRQNIRAASLRLNITVEEEWDGEYNYNF